MPQRKQLGQFFTPPEVARSLVSWLAPRPADRLLDPSCGNGQFLALHRRSVGVEVDAVNACKYRAILNIDFTHQKTVQYQKLVAALMQSGWVYLETTAFLLEGELPQVLQTFELIAKQCQSCGELSALTLQIQGSNDFRGRRYRAKRFHPHALQEIKAKPFP